MKASAVVVGGLGLAASYAAEAQAEAAALDAWNKSLLERGERRVYRGDELKHIAMPLGGIGGGQVYLRGDGTLNPWQIVNNFNFGANAPGSCFAVWARKPGCASVARLLQLDAIGDARGVDAIEFAGEYPFAWLQYRDAALPIEASLEAFTPFIPLNEKDSAIPTALFRFTLRNPSNETVEAALLSAMPNLVGWDGYAPLNGVEHSDYGFNKNELDWRAKDIAALRLGVVEGTGHRISRATQLLTSDQNVAYHMRHCSNLKVNHGSPLPIENRGRATDVHWVADVGGRVDGEELVRILDAVKKGATAIITNDDDALLLLVRRKHREELPEIFEDWKSGCYANWTIEGDCFGAAPTKGTLSGQLEVSGWEGKYFVNTFVDNDSTTGKATSKAFTIAKRYIHLRVGGGNHADETCVNLVVDGMVVATATGENTEHLRPVQWDVAAHKGKTAHIEIVDASREGWGHILVDTIYFSDSPLPREFNDQQRERYREALPITWAAIDESRIDSPLDYKSPALRGVASRRDARVAFHRMHRLHVKPGARVLLQAEDGTPLAVAGKYGTGNLAIVLGSPDAFFEGSDKKALIGNLIAMASGTVYEPMTGVRPDHPLSGSMELAVLDAAHNVTARPQWDDFSHVWADFVDGGELSGTGANFEPSAPGRTWNGALSTRVTLAPGEAKDVSIVLAWHFPNRTRDSSYGWGPGAYQYDYRLGNRYNTWFKNAGEVVDYVAANRARLNAETKLFHDTLYDSSLPRYLLDAVSANAATIGSPIYVWLEDGTFGGFEGADRCCPMNCTHVYNYAMSTAYLFPALERNVRETDLLVQMNPSEHYIPHRTILPLSLPRLGNKIGGPEHPALDGELGTVLKTYREWKLCGDRAWLEKLWPRAKTLMTYIMEHHDPGAKGLIQGEQPNTYDTHLFGSNTFIGSLYLAALRASEEMALAVNDTDATMKFHERFALGHEAYDRICWNGHYYYNVFDAPNADEKTYNSVNCYGPGCHADQLFGQWWAFMLGLGHVLPKEHVRAALKTMHQYNWLPDLSNFHHKQRIFAEGKERGLLCCTWPKGGRPENPILYCDEVWTGIEYHVAASLIHEGMLEEGLQIVRGARDRYTGNQRNPWAEIECGYHYARAMSAHSLLVVAAGLDYDASSARLSIAPKIAPENFRGFFSTGQAWGTVSQTKNGHTQHNTIEIAHGELELQKVCVESKHHDGNISVSVNGAPAIATQHPGEGVINLAFAEPQKLKSGDRVEIILNSV